MNKKPGPTPISPQVTPPRKGLAHILDAAGYSIAGFRRLMGETAARLELGAATFTAVLFLLRGASAGQWLGLVCLWLAVLAIEALNTAIEVLTDRLSPEWSIEAKHAKDLGSLAVGLGLTITAIYCAWVVLGF